MEEADADNAHLTRNSKSLYRLSGKIRNCRPQARQSAAACRILHISKMDLYLRFDQPVTESELADIRVMLKRRALHEPLQYILGKTDFYGLEFNVDQHVLIPRMDTETLVDDLLSTIEADEKHIKLLDIGTGSGCIPISIAKHHSEVEAIGMDISEGALTLARQNAELNGVCERVTFFRRDLFTDMRVRDKFDIVVSNPPYIAAGEMAGRDREVREYEPRMALSDEGDGLRFYQRIAEVLPDILVPGGLIWLEIGYEQGESVCKLFEEILCEVEIVKDLAGHDRIIKGKLGL